MRCDPNATHTGRHPPNATAKGAPQVGERAPAPSTAEQLRAFAIALRMCGTLDVLNTALDDGSIRLPHPCASGAE